MEGEETSHTDGSEQPPNGGDRPNFDSYVSQLSASVYKRGEAFDRDLLAVNSLMFGGALVLSGKITDHRWLAIMGIVGLAASVFLQLYNMKKTCEQESEFTDSLLRVEDRPRSWDDLMKRHSESVKAAKTEQLNLATWWCSVVGAVLFLIAVLLAAPDAKTEPVINFHGADASDESMGNNDGVRGQHYMSKPPFPSEPRPDNPQNPTPSQPASPGMPRQGDRTAPDRRQAEVPTIVKPIESTPEPKDSG